MVDEFVGVDRDVGWDWVDVVMVFCWGDGGCVCVF